MKVKYYTKMLIPFCVFGMIFRILEIFFGVDSGTSLYKPGSIIPIMFNIFSLLIVLFFVSALFSLPKGKKEISRRLNAFSPVENVVFVVTAVLLLSSGMKEFVFGFLEKTFRTAPDIFKSAALYLFIVSVFAALFFVQMASSPRRTLRSNAWAVISLALPLYYIICLFASFTKTESIVIHVYSSYEIIKLSAIALSLLNFVKVFTGNFNRRWFLIFSHIAVYFTAIRFADLILSFIPSDRYQISIDPLRQLCDMLVCVALVLILIRVSKKVKRTDGEVPARKTEGNEP